jgi:hypothetical protein
VPSEAIAGSAAAGLSGEVDIFARRLHLRQLVFSYQGQLARLTSLQVRQRHRLELESQAENWSGFSETSPHPFLRADELKESVIKLSNRVDELESWFPAIDQTGVQIVNVAQNSTVKLRQADEAVEQAKEAPDQQARLDRERDMLALQNQFDLARAMGYQIEKQTVQEELLEARAQLQLARKQLSVASEHVALTQQDIDQVQKKSNWKTNILLTNLNKRYQRSTLKINPAYKKSLRRAPLGELPSCNPPSLNRLISYARHNGIMPMLNCKHLTGY